MLVNSITEEELYGRGNGNGRCLFRDRSTKEARHILDFCYKCGYFVKRLAKPTILCYYFNSKTQRLKYQ